MVTRAVFRVGGLGHGPIDQRGDRVLAVQGVSVVAPGDRAAASSWNPRNLTAYDAVYVALAEVLDTSLLTCDAKLARAPGVAGRAQRV